MSAMMLVYFKQNNFDSSFCFENQHDRYAYCLLCLLGLSENTQNLDILALTLFFSKYTIVLIPIYVILQSFNTTEAFTAPLQRFNLLMASTEQNC